mmetsp:Transcript_11782/g.37505  ORF Transcript_11782/g.37505 Transcript_11782/m.37505 type:complete len:139 (+) Transcript_11782:1381-1797(+)
MLEWVEDLFDGNTLIPVFIMSCTDYTICSLAHHIKYIVSDVNVKAYTHDIVPLEFTREHVVAVARHFAIADFAVGPCFDAARAFRCRLGFSPETSTTRHPKHVNRRRKFTYLLVERAYSAAHRRIDRRCLQRHRGAFC